MIRVWHDTKPTTKWQPAKDDDPGSNNKNMHAWQYALNMVNRNGVDVFENNALKRRMQSIEAVFGACKPPLSPNTRVVVIGALPDVTTFLAEKGVDWIVLTPTTSLFSERLRAAKQPSGHRRVRVSTTLDEATRAARVGQTHFVYASEHTDPNVLAAFACADTTIVEVADARSPPTDLVAAACKGRASAKLCKAMTCDATSPAVAAVWEGRGDGTCGWPSHAALASETRRAMKTKCAMVLYAYYNAFSLTTRALCEEHYRAHCKEKEKHACIAIE
jgi:hypothetical protein